MMMTAQVTPLHDRSTPLALSADLLSKQAHYDWGLRAVKSVLRVAGKLKRAEPKVNEEAILMSSEGF